MELFLEKIDKFLDRSVSSGDKLLVGISGGADSISLLHVLCEFSKIKNFSLAVAHVNHMTRGGDSYADAEFVGRISKELELPFFLKEIEVDKECVKLKRSFQETARMIRYQFFEKTLNAIGGNKIALGHSADDQAETILLNIIRGAGLKGLTGMPQIRGNIIRPFLNVYRKELEAYLKEKEIPFRNDSSNNDAKYLRNKIRKELIPCLESYNPAIKKTISDMSGILLDDDSLLSKMTQDIFNQKFCFQEGEDKELVWEIESFLSYPMALRRRLIRETFYKITGEMRGITALHVEQILNLFESPKTGRSLNMPRDVSVNTGYNVVAFKKNLGWNRKGKYERDMPVIAVQIPGITKFEDGGIQVQTQIIDEKIRFSPLNQKIEAFFDLEKTGPNLMVRFFRAGDRFQPLGMTGSKKLKSFFIDKKIPHNIRHRIPILTNDKDDIIWVYGQRIAHFCRVTDKTKKVLFVQGNKAINY